MASVIACIAYGVFFRPLPRSPSDTDGTYGWQLAEAQTVGDRTYVPIDYKGPPEAHGATVASIVRAFSAAHPDLRIVSWRVDASVRFLEPDGIDFK